MSIRWKLLILLLAIALLPLGVIGYLEYISLARMGKEFGSAARESRIDRAGRQLLQIATDYGAIVKREAATIEVVLQAQAREVERELVSPPPDDPQIIWAHYFDQADTVPENSSVSDRHIRKMADGRRLPMYVNYDYQSFKLAPGVDLAGVEDDVARLSDMADAYRYLRQGHAELILWQYTGLAAGVHCSYPAHGGYDPEYDPRRRPWYQNAAERGGIVWNAPNVDASTGQAVLSVSMPVRLPDGNLAGVTGIDIDVLELVRDVRVPRAWSAEAQTMLVVNPAGLPEQTHSLLAARVDDRAGLTVIAQQSYADTGLDWNVPLDLEVLESADERAMAAMAEDMRQHRPGVRKMPYHGKDSLWAYASADEQAQAFVLLIVPYDEIIAQAVVAEQRVTERIRQRVRAAGITMIVIAVLTLVIAIVGSRTVTRPIDKLAETAQRVAQGDFEARAEIQSRDEFGALARTVNAMVPQLEDRMRLRQSLSVAMEVQQHLLPKDAPRIEGLDVAGRSIYCDETGGDYYDFLELTELGPRHLGVAVGDVTGHGIAAALLMATGRALLRSRVGRPGTLAEMISEINQHLTFDSSAGRFMTLVYLVVDAETRTLRWVSAGHDPPITFDPASGCFDELMGGGIPLGIEDSWEYEEQTAAAPAGGQVIVLGTDGIWESRNEANEMFGKDRVREIISQHATGTADEIADAITTEVVSFRESRAQEDDITLVVIRVLPAEAEEPGL